MVINMNNKNRRFKTYLYGYVSFQRRAKKKVRGQIDIDFTDHIAIVLSDNN